MIRHIVFFKFKPDTPPEDRSDFVRRLRALREGVPGIVELEVGQDFLHSPRSFDVGLMVIFNDRPSLARYQSHPNHIPVPQRAREICEASAVVDYEF